MIIYKVTNTKNNLIYIGQTTRELETRMKEHLRKRKTYFDSCYCKKHLKDFVVEIIDTAESIDELNKKEIFYIKKYNSMIPNGYNACEGGENSIGYHHTKESRDKMSNARKGKNTGEENPFFNKHHSKEQREKWSAERKGLAHLTDEQKQKLKESHHKVKVLNIDTNEMFDSIKDASEKYNIIATNITRVCKGKIKTTGGFHWKYAE